MKTIYTVLLLSFGFSLYAQNKGMNYQAVILDPDPIEIPGANLGGQPLASKKICIKFNFSSSKGVLEYSESQQTVSDEFGLINVVIGNGMNKSIINSAALTSFSQLNWDENQKTLAVYVSLDDCLTYKLVGTQPLTYAPYALYADAVDYKNVRDSPSKVSFFINDLGYLIPKDLDKIKSNVAQNAMQIDLNQKKIESNDVLTKQSFSDLGKILDNHAGKIGEMGGLIDQWGTKIVDQDIRIDQQNKTITQNQSTVLTHLGVVNAKISDIKSSIDILDQHSEKLSSKSNEIDLGAANPSSQLYPTQRATKSYVDNSILAAVGSGVPDATTLAVGKLRLSGDLSGTASNPTVPALQFKEDLSNKSANIQVDAASYSKYPSVKAVKDYVDQATLGIALQVTLDGKADKNSPTFTGIPVMPTGTIGVTQGASDNSTKLATTAFVQLATTGIAFQATVDAKADKNSPTFTGVPVMPTGTIGVTQAFTDSSTKLATTAFIKQAAAGVFSQINIDAKADKNSPTFTGIPVMPTGTIGVTQASTDSSTKLATTAFIKQAAAGVFSQINIDAKADKNSPTFTGIPVMPTGTIGVTQASTDSTTKMATTAFVKNITAQLNVEAKADRISPVFTGTPTLPSGTIAITQNLGNNSNAIATTAFVIANANSSGHQSITAGSEISTSSTTDLPVNGMTISAVAGKYIVSFNSQYSLEAANVTGQASVDLTTAYIYLMTKPVTIFGHGVLYGAAGGGEVLGPGVYSNAAAVTTAGILTLDGGGNPNAEFVFNFGAAFSTGASFEVILRNGASACNVYWVVEGAIALGANTSMKGFLISNNGAIALGSNSTVDGSLFSKLGAIDILSSTIIRSVGCINNFGTLNNFAIYSKVGAVSNTGNSKITGNIGYDGLSASLVTGFGSAIVYGEIFTAGISSAIANFSLYQNGTLIPFSSRKRVSKYPLGEINLQAIATVGAGENIDVRWNVDTGIIKLQNRVFTILSVRD